MTMFSAEKTKTFTTFEEYPWDADGVFRAGLPNILRDLPPEQDHDFTETEKEERQLLRAKHFFFSRFNHAFNLDDYVKYKATKNTLGAKHDSDSEALFKRLEGYDFDQDDTYLAGLALIIEQWVRQQTEKGLIWDKSRLDDEFKKARADYYAANIEPVDLDLYYEWLKEKKEADKPACPFAHMWRNKGGGKTRFAAAESNGSFVVASETRGATTLVLASPGTKNIITVGRLDELKQNFTRASEHSTSLMIRATPNANVLSSGLAYEETVLATAAISGSNQEQRVLGSLNKLEGSYYNFVEEVLLQQVKKPTLVFVNGQVPLDAAYLFLWHGFTRVITEHAMLEFGLNLSVAPVPPLLLMLLCRQRSARKLPLPEGMELYLALAPPELVRLRGPELLRLGLADIFIPEVQLDDMYDTLNKMSICPAPKTAAALQLALASVHAYPGPNRLGAWENEIERTFGDSETLDEIQIKLQAMDSTWSAAILAHWDSLPPTLLEVVFRAVRTCSNAASPSKVLDLEKSINSCWRRSRNYALWRTQAGHCSRKWETEDVDAYFRDGLACDPDYSKMATAVYEAPIIQDTSACPMTQQDPTTVGTARCPVEGKNAADCPVTWQVNSMVAQTCPVTGRSVSATAVCPATGQKGLACPVTGEHA